MTTTTLEAFLAKQDPKLVAAARKKADKMLREIESHERESQKKAQEKADATTPPLSQELPLQNNSEK